jgi:hypothetical protein
MRVRLGMAILLLASIARAQTDLIVLNPGGVPGFTKQSSAMPFTLADQLCATSTGTIGYGGTCNVGGGGGSGDITDVWSCTAGNCNTLTAASGDSFDAGSATSSKPCVRGTTLPGTCTEGDCFQDTDSGELELYVCTATNTWTKGLSALDLDTSAELAAIVGDETGSGALVFGTSPTLTTPTIASFTNAQHTHQNAAGGGVLDLTLATTGTLGVARGGTGLTATADDTMLVGSAATTYQSKLLPDCDAANNALNYDQTTNTFTCATLTGTGDITDVWQCTSGNCNALTAASGDSFDAGAADSTKPCKRGTTLPGTCAEGDCFQDTDLALGTETYVCTAANTWAPIPPHDAQYIVRASSTLLPNARTITPGVGLLGVDGGPGGSYTLGYDYSVTLASNTLASGQCLFDSTESGILCEGTTDANEMVLAFPNVASDQTLTLPNGTGTLTAGPTSTTDQGIVRWDGTTGGFVQDSMVTIDDANLISAVTTVTATSGTVRGLDYLAQLNNTLASSATLSSIRGRAYFIGSEDATGTIRGVYGLAENQGTDANDNLTGLTGATFEATSQVGSASTGTAITGVRVVATKQGTGAVTSLIGGQFAVGNYNVTGTVTDAYTILLDTVDATGPITRKWGVYQSGPEINSFGGPIQFRGTSAGASTFTAGSSVANMQYTLPSVAPAANGYVLSTTTGGQLSWIADGAGSEGPGIDITTGTVSWDPITYVNNVTLWNSANASRTLTAGLSGTSDPILTFNDNNLDVTGNFSVTSGSVDEVMTSTATTSINFGGRFQLTAAPATTSTGSYYGTRSLALTSTSAAAGSSVRGALTRGECRTSNGCATVYGLAAEAYNIDDGSSADVSAMYGVWSRLNQSSLAGTAGAMYTYYAEDPTIDTGGATSVYQFYSAGTRPSSLGGPLEFRGSSSGITTLSAGATPATITYTMPTAAPASNGSALTSTTGGQLSWSQKQRACISTGSIAAASIANVSVTWTTPYADTNYTVIGGVYDNVTTSIAAIELSHASAKTTTTASAVLFNRDATSAHTGTLCLEGLV